MSNIKQALAHAYSSPLWAASRLNNRTHTTIARDVRRWADCLGWHDLAVQSTDRQLFGILVMKLPEFRSLLRYRLNPKNILAALLLKKCWPGEKTLHIHCDSIGPGLFIQHGFATTITAESIGEDCWINQQVTIGYTRKGKPTIGSRVSIGAGAVVVGPIHISDDVQIGVNATITKAVSPSKIMVGPQATELRTAIENND